MTASLPGFERWLEAYAHEGRIAVLVEFAFEDPVSARTEEFRRFARDTALQVTAMAPGSVAELLQQECLKSHGTLVEESLQAISALLGDRLHIVRFERWVAAVEPPAQGFEPPDSPANVIRFPQRA